MPALRPSFARRFDPGGGGARGVHLLYLSPGQGPRVRGGVPAAARGQGASFASLEDGRRRDEERRLLYVGITRAKRTLALTWSGRPSPFLRELGIEPAGGGARPPAGADERRPRDRSPAAEALRRWRLERARAEAVPAYVIFPDRTIDEILERRPASVAELAGIHGLGPSRLGRFGGELSAAIEEALATWSTSARPQARRQR